MQGAHTHIGNNCIIIVENKYIQNLLQSSNTVFSAGLDFLEMYQPKEERLKSFWTTLQSTWMTLYASKIPTAAAINVSYTSFFAWGQSTNFSKIGFLHS